MLLDGARTEVLPRDDAVGACPRAGGCSTAKPRTAATLRRIASAFARTRGGASAVEFALVALPFLMLLGVVLESSMLVFSQQTLDVAMGRATRVLRTGEFQDTADGSDPSERLRRVMCSGTVFFRCDDLKLDLARGASFSSVQVMQPYDTLKQSWADGFGTRFSCPSGNEVVALRAAVPVMRLFTFLDFTRQIMGRNTQLIVATAIFRTEPYSGKTCQ